MEPGKPVTLAGVGSRFSRDDEIGLRLVEAIAGRGSTTAVECRLWEDADALSLANELLELDRDVVIVDCADMGLAGGSWRLFADDAVRLRIRADPLSTHGLGLAEALSIARSLGFKPCIRIFGVQPFDLSPGPGLSARMQDAFPDLLAALMGTVLRPPGWAVPTLDNPVPRGSQA